MKKIIAILTAFLMCLLITGCGGNESDAQNIPEGSDTQAEKNVQVAEKETVKELTAKFNTQILESGMEYPASDDFLPFQTKNIIMGCMKILLI